MRWFQELPEGPCRVALAHLMDQALNDGASDEVALEQGLAHAARLFPEEMVLWGLEGRLGPAPWQDVGFQGSVRAASVHLRELRSQFVDLAQENAALLEEVQVLRASLQLVQSPEASEPVQPPADFVPFSGTGHSLGAEDLSGLD